MYCYYSNFEHLDIDCNKHYTVVKWTFNKQLHLEKHFNKQLFSQSLGRFTDASGVALLLPQGRWSPCRDRGRVTLHIWRGVLVLLQVLQQHQQQATISPIKRKDSKLKTGETSKMFYSDVGRNSLCLLHYVYLNNFFPNKFCLSSFKNTH